MAQIPAATLERIAPLIAAKHLELTSAGYSAKAADGGIERALGMADFHTRPLPDAIRGEAFERWFVVELGHVETYMVKFARGIAK